MKGYICEVFADGHAARAPTEVKAESAVNKVESASSNASATNIGGGRTKEVRDAKRTDELMADSGSGIGALPLSSSMGGREGESGNESTALPQTNSGMSESLQECRHQQLRLLNEKLAKRHSKLPRREALTLSAGQFQSPEPSIGRGVAKMQTQQSARHKGGKSPQSSANEGIREGVEGLTISGVARTEDHLEISPSLVRKTALMRPIVSHTLPGKSVTLRPEPPLTSTSLHPNTATEAFSTQDPLPTPPQSVPEPMGELLDSESSFLPLVPIDFSHHIFHSHESTSLGHMKLDPEIQDTDFYVSSLLSSLDSAYGYSSLAEKSRLLSSLVATEEVSFAEGVATDGTPKLRSLVVDDWSDVTRTMGKVSTSSLIDPRTTSVVDFDWAAAKIQAVYRGYVARKQCKTHLRELKAASLIQATWWVTSMY